MMQEEKVLLKMMGGDTDGSAFEIFDQNYMLSSPCTLSSNDPRSLIMICNQLSMLVEKVKQVQSMVNVVIFPEQGLQEYSAAMPSVASMATLLQEIVILASSVAFACQKIMNPDTHTTQNGEALHHNILSGITDTSRSRTEGREEDTADEPFFSTIDKLGLCEQAGNYNEMGEEGVQYRVRTEEYDSRNFGTDHNCEIIELNAEDLLVRYTHYCQVCGKGFKRDANLRMHMRAHGDEYKSAALVNPAKSRSSGCGDSNSGQYRKGFTGMIVNDYPRKKYYSCPQVGCRWNKKHTNFQPLKSMICVKNHYKRSHCPKMYICTRCNWKQFSLLSDLRTHEKHCGDLKWLCSCGNTFSRKGHSPVPNC